MTPWLSFKHKVDDILQKFPAYCIFCFVTISWLHSYTKVGEHKHKAMFRRYKSVDRVAHTTRKVSSTTRQASHTRRKQTNTSTIAPCTECNLRSVRPKHAGNSMTFPCVLCSNIIYQQDLMTVDAYRSKYGNPNLLFLISDQHRFDVFGRAAGGPQNSKFTSA